MISVKTESRSKKENVVSRPDQWIHLHCPGWMIEEAKAFVETRHTVISNPHFPRAEDDREWCGPLSERRVDAWMTEHAIPHAWLDSDPSISPGSAPDFRIGGYPPHYGVGVDLKCRRRSRGHILATYEVSVGAWHLRGEKAIAFLFSCWEEEYQQIVLLGGMWQTDILRHGRHFGAGETIHESLTLREKGELYNLYIHQLMPPWPFIESLRTNMETMDDIPTPQQRGNGNREPQGAPY